MFENQFLYFISYWDLLYSSRLKFTKLITEAQQREAVTRKRSLPSIPATVYMFPQWYCTSNKNQTSKCKE
jgi:hypothetical protein